MAAPTTTAGSKQANFESLPGGVKLMLLFGLIALVSALYYFALHMKIAEELEQSKSTFITLQSQEKEAQKRQREYLDLKQELDAREVVDRQNKRVLPEQAEIPAFLQDLNRVAELSGLRIRIVEPRPEEPQELYVRIPVSLGISGRFHQIAKFFFNVSRLERAINIENVSLTEPSSQAEEVVLKVDVLATTFRRPSEEAIAAASGAGGTNAQPTAH